MSKAFVNEEAASATVEVPAGRPRGESGEPRYITSEGHERLKAEAAGLERRRAGGDTSREVETRLAILDEALGAVTVAPLPDDTDAIYFGAWVELEDEDGETLSYRLVGPDEVDVPARWISIGSPLARALLGRHVGDTVEVQRPKGTHELTVRAIRYRGS